MQLIRAGCQLVRDLARIVTSVPSWWADTAEEELAGSWAMHLQRGDPRSLEIDLDWDRDTINVREQPEPREPRAYRDFMAGIDPR